MTNYGVILKRVRQENGISLKIAAKKINKSAGWLSEVENSKGSSKIKEGEFNRILDLYDGRKFKNKFPGWVTNSKEINPLKELSFNGAIYKYLRLKNKITQKDAAKILDVSNAYLSMIESGIEIPTEKLHIKIVETYKYSPNSFKNFKDINKGANRIPTIFKLNILLKKFPEEKIIQIFDFASNLIQEGEKEC